MAWLERVTVAGFRNLGRLPDFCHLKKQQKIRQKPSPNLIMHVTDGQTDRQTDRYKCDLSMVAERNVYYVTLSNRCLSECYLCYQQHTSATNLSTHHHQSPWQPAAAAAAITCYVWCTIAETTRQENASRTDAEPRSLTHSVSQPSDR